MMNRTRRAFDPCDPNSCALYRARQAEREADELANELWELLGEPDDLTLCVDFDEDGASLYVFDEAEGDEGTLTWAEAEDLASELVDLDPADRLPRVFEVAA